MTEKERELQDQINALHADRRKEDVDRWDGLSQTLKEQNASLGRIENTNVATSLRLASIEGRLTAGDARMNAQDEKQNKHADEDKSMMALLSSRVDGVELDIRFWKRIVKWLTGVMTTLGLGWVAVKFGWKN